jgi:hypothetical protein
MFNRASTTSTIDMAEDSYRTRGNTQGATWQVKITKARNEDPILIHASRKPNTHKSRYCDLQFKAQRGDFIHASPIASQTKDTDHTFKYLNSSSPPLNHPSMQASPFSNHCSLCLFYTRIVHFPLSRDAGGHLFIDLGEDTVITLVSDMSSESNRTYSWSRNREYSSSPTLTGDPPYCSTCQQSSSITRRASAALPISPGM